MRFRWCYVLAYMIYFALLFSSYSVTRKNPNLVCKRLDDPDQREKTLFHREVSSKKDGGSCGRRFRTTMIFWKLMMEGLPSVIPKSIVEVLNRLENDEDNLFWWKLTRSQDSFSLTVSCKLRAKTPNKAKDDSGVTGRTTVKKPVRRRRRKKNRSPSA